MIVQVLGYFKCYPIAMSISYFIGKVESLRLYNK